MLQVSWVKRDVGGRVRGANGAKTDAVPEPEDRTSPSGTLLEVEQFWSTVWRLVATTVLSGAFCLSAIWINLWMFGKASVLLSLQSEVSVISVLGWLTAILLAFQVLTRATPMAGSAMQDAYGSIAMLVSSLGTWLVLGAVLAKAVGRDSGFLVELCLALLGSFVMACLAVDVNRAGDRVLGEAVARERSDVKRRRALARVQRHAGTTVLNPALLALRGSLAFIVVATSAALVLSVDLGGLKNGTVASLGLIFISLTFTYLVRSTFLSADPTWGFFVAIGALLCASMLAVMIMVGIRESSSGAEFVVTSLRVWTAGAFACLAAVSTFFSVSLPLPVRCGGSRTYSGVGLRLMLRRRRDGFLRNGASAERAPMDQFVKVGAGASFAGLFFYAVSIVSVLIISEWVLDVAIPLTVPFALLVSPLPATAAVLSIAGLRRIRKSAQILGGAGVAKASIAISLVSFASTAALLIVVAAMEF